MTLLETNGLTKRYGDRTVVDGVGFQVDAGEIVGLLGPNGAGKTTTFRMTVGMISPDAGEVRLNGTEVTHLPMYQRARQGMGYLSQEPSIFRGLSVRDNLLAVLEARGLSRNARRDRADELLEEFGIEHVQRAQGDVARRADRHARPEDPVGEARARLPNASQQAHYEVHRPPSRTRAEVAHVSFHEEGAACQREAHAQGRGRAGCWP